MVCSFVRRTAFCRCIFVTCALVCACLIPFSGDARAGFADAGKQEEEMKADKLAPDLERILTAVLNAVPEGGVLPPEADLVRLVNFMTAADTMPDMVMPAEREEGEGVFSRRALRLPFPKLLRYCFDPSLPTEVLYPTVLRRGYWLPQSAFAQQRAGLWTRLGGKEPVVLRGAEYEEITPDSFSGCYYHYTLQRLIVLMQAGGRNVVLSVSRQKAPSSVGRKGAVVGRDSDWNYVYTRAVGSNLKLVGWAETYMYGSANVSVMYENGEESGLAFFKWVKAGWSNLNMVKSKHILAGGRRFLDGMRQVLESAELPKPEEIRARYEKFQAMDDAGLRAAFAPHAASLENRAAGDSLLSSKDFRAALEGGVYPGQLGREDIISELMKLYMKERLGLRAAALMP